MTEFLEDFLNKKSNILKDPTQNEQFSEYDIDEFDFERLQTVPFENLTRDEKVSIVFVLLRQLQPYLSANNLTVVAPRRQVMQNNLMQSQEGSIYNTSMSQIRNKSDGKYASKPMGKRGNLQAGRSVDRGNFG